MHPDISQMQCELLGDTVRRRKLSTERQPLVSSSTLMKLVSTVLHFSIREGLFWQVFRNRGSRMLTTPLRQLISGRYSVEQFCVEVLDRC